MYISAYFSNEMLLHNIKKQSSRIICPDVYTTCLLLSDNLLKIVFMLHFYAFYLNYFAVIYPCAFNNSAINTAPPAAPRTVLCDKPTNL